MLSNPSTDSRLTIPFWALLAYYVIAALLILFVNTNSILAGIFVYPAVSILPILFFFASVSGKDREIPAESDWLFAIGVGPVFSALLGTIVLYVRPDITLAVRTLLLAGFVFGITSALRRKHWLVPRPNGDWLFPAIFIGAAVLLVIIPLSKTILMRIAHDGPFHDAVSMRIIFRGVPPEDPLFPGETVHNYWFYHAWGAILAWVLHRPPVDAFSIMNVHALIAVLLAVWFCSGLVFHERRERYVSLIFATVAMNAPAFIYLLISYAHNFVVIPKPFYPPDILDFTVFLGDERIPNFLAKFIPANAFPLGVCLYAMSLYACLKIYRKRADFISASSLFLAVLGTFLFHPTSAIGLGVGIGGGMLLAAIAGKEFKSIPWWVAISAAAGCAVSIPYLITIFPSHTERIRLALSAINALATFSPHIFLMPLVVAGAGCLLKTKDRTADYLIGFAVGTTAAALFFALPGHNQYKFIQLLSIPAGLVAAAAFRDDFFRKIEKPILMAFAVFVIINTIIGVYAYVESRWWKEELFAEEGLHINPKGIYIDDTDFYRWVRENTSIDAILVSPASMVELILFSERSSITGTQNWVSMGHVEEEYRMRMLQEVIGDRQIPAEFIEYLRKFKRPIYFVLPPILTANEIIKRKFETRPDLFKLVYNDDLYRLYKLEFSR